MGVRWRRWGDFRPCYVINYAGTQMAEEPILADIQMPFLEYRANYKEPITSIWFDRRQGDVIDAPPAVRKY